MNGLAATIAAFGAEIGMQDLAPNEKGHVALQTATGQQVSVESAGADVLICVSEPTPYDSTERLLRAWRRAHYTKLEGWPVQAALREQDGVMRLLAVTRLPADDFAPRTLRDTIDYLSRWLDATRHD